ncbi:MAG TPA: hypothetical protein VNA13_01690 [Xanthomonadales bacterium]|nr:hypothetical protein [Xanthomonadales bacterium]
MKNKSINKAFLQELAQHENSYVLLSKSENKILAVGKDLKTLLKKQEAKKITGGVLHYVPPIDAALSLQCR